MSASTAPAPATPRLVEPAGDGLEQSPTDVLRMVVAAVGLLVLLLVELLFGNALVTFLSDLLRGLDAVPSWLLEGLIVAVRVAAVVWLVVGTVRAVASARWPFLVRVAAGAALAVVLFALVSLVDPDTGAVVAQEVVTAGFPSAYGLAAIAGGLTASAPWMGRRWREAAWALVLLMSAGLVLSTPMSFAAARALLTGLIGGSAALVLLRGPRRRPTVRGIAEGLADNGVHLAELTPAAVDARGSTPFLGTTTDGQRVFVKALGNDERSADLLFRAWRRVSNRNLGDEKAFSTLRRAVEHEAFLALAARDRGIPTPRFLALAEAEPNGFALCYEAVDGRSLDKVPPEEMTDDLLHQAWTQVGDLRRWRIAHRDLRLANLFRTPAGDVLLIDFGFSELAASQLLLDTDVAELLGSTTTVVGPERAVAAARAVLGDATVHVSLPRLHLKYLSGATRTALKGSKGTLEALRGLVGTGSA